MRLAFIFSIIILIIMRKYTFAVIFAAVALIGVGVSALAAKNEFPVAPVYVNPVAPEIPMIASYAFDDSNFLTPEKFHELRDAGFNMNRQSMNEETVQKALKAMEGTGIKMMLYSWDALNPQKTVKTINKYKDNPIIGAYFVSDEPKLSQFGDVKRINDLMRQVDTTKFTYINLFPIMGPKHIEAPDYRTYVEEFVRTVNPPVLSFDCYPTMLKKGKVTLRENYFENIEIISDVARKSGRPFFSYILSTKHLDFAKQNRDLLRFQIFSALGYGAQGLNYYTYCLPGWDTEGDYTDAPIDKNGNKTDVWYAHRDVHREVHNLEKYFLGCEVVDVSHTGSSLPDGTKYLATLPVPFKTLKSNGVGVMVSHFKNNGKNYLLIVNRDLNKKQKVNFTKMYPVTRITGDGKRKLDRDSSVSLSPGGYALYEF